MNSYNSSCLGLIEGVILLGLSALIERNISIVAVFIIIPLIIILLVINTIVCKDKKFPTIIQGHTVDLEGVTIQAEKQNEDSIKTSISVSGEVYKIHDNNMLEIKSALDDYLKVFKKEN